jgi:subtilisin family serine protease
MKVSNDTYSDTQWALNNPGKYTSYNEVVKEELRSTEDVDMNIPEAWSYLKSEEGSKREVVVAIIDTGVDYKHPELAEQMWVNEKEIPEDGLDNDNNGYIDDVNGWDFYNGDSSICHYKYNEKHKMSLSDPDDNDDHGTHIAGIIAAAANNSIGIAGAASDINIKLMVLKINGGPDGTGNISSAVEAIKYATMMGADICNLSWGTSSYTPALREVMEESDMLFVAAAGNTGTNNNAEPIYPANLSLKNLISVTFVDADGRLTYLSNYGDVTVDIAAPGNDIFSTVVGTYSAMSGSSMAAPQVSAVAALVYSVYDNVFPSNVKEVILNNIKPLPDLEGEIKHPGIPDAFLAVSAAADGILTDTVAPVINVKTIYDKGTIKVPVQAVDEGGSDIRVVRWLSGEKTLADFNRGTDGTLVKRDEVSIEKAGTYTFYAGDYAGNESLLVYEVKDDATPPKITSSYNISSTYKTRTVSVRVTDNQSSVKRVKYMAGVKTATDFRPAGAGTELTLKEGRGTFKVKKDGIYTIFAIDNRGNAVVRQVNIKTIKATELKFSRISKTLTEGGQYTLRIFMKPVNTTDQVTYKSSDETVATVSDTGVIKARKVGSTYITAKSSSGVTTYCEITVVKK